MKTKMIFLMICSLLLAGCGGQRAVEATATAEFFLTAEAALTEVAQVTPTSQPTWTPSPTATDWQLITPSPAATTRVPFYEQPTATSGISCDQASFITDVTVPDNTAFAPGESFTKTWRLRNDGSCAWTEEYTVAFVSGNQLGGKTTSLPRTIGINETLDISVEMKAPLLAGEYTSNWTIRNQNGISFGDLFYVQIVVTSSATETFTPAPTAAEPTQTPSPSPTSGTTQTETPEPSATITPTATETQE